MARIYKIYTGVARLIPVDARQIFITSVRAQGDLIPVGIFPDSGVFPDSGRKVRI